MKLIAIFCLMFLGCGHCVKKAERFPMLIEVCDTTYSGAWVMGSNGLVGAPPIEAINCHWDTLWMRSIR